MFPFFYELKKDIFSDNLKKYISKITFGKMKQFYDYGSRANDQPDGNRIYFGPLLDDHDEIKAVVDSCVLDCLPVIILHYPNIEVIKHSDDGNNRSCVISTPIYPSDNYAPTLFWKELTDQDPIVCDYPDRKPVLLNTKKVHSLKTKDSMRINFQLSFSADFEEVVQLYETNSLFKLDRNLYA